ncbi:hypothetical protein C1645_784750, partial [Glomus cerebriforme]
MFICILFSVYCRFVTSFSQFFSFIFISNLYSYTLFLTNSILLFLGPLVLPVLQLRSFSSFGSTINKGFLLLSFAIQPPIMIIFLFFV